MNFPVYNYKEYHNENTCEHPIQPYSWGGWVKMVNENQDYCKNFTVYKWLKYLFFIVIGRIEASDVPSFHPYWGIGVLKKTRKSLKTLKKKYEECKLDENKIKFLFNNSTFLPDIKIMVDKKEKEIKSHPFIIRVLSKVI